MSIEKDRIEEEEALIENELEQYKRLIRKEREKSEPSSSFTISKDGKRAKTVSLSTLVKLSVKSPHNTELSKEELDSKIRDLADKIIQTYR
jgi:ribose 1,5-bisphosphokinase PhnN